MWNEYAQCIKTIRNFISAEKPDERKTSNGAVQRLQDCNTSSPCMNIEIWKERRSTAVGACYCPRKILAVPANVIDGWWKCFLRVQQATKEIDLRGVLCYLPQSALVSVELPLPPLSFPSSSDNQEDLVPSKNLRMNSKGLFLSTCSHEAVRDILWCALRRQVLLYNSHSISFAELHGRFVRWSVLILLWIYYRVMGCIEEEQTNPDDELQDSEVQRYRFFLSTASPLFGHGNGMRETPPTVMLQRILHFLSGARHLGEAPKGIIGSPAEQRLRVALVECMDAAHQDSFRVSWNSFRPSSLPATVMIRLKDKVSVWLTQMANDEEVSLLSQLKYSSHRRRRNINLEKSLSLGWSAVLKRNLLSPQESISVSPDSPPFSFLSPLQFAWETSISELEHWNLSLNFMDYFQRTLNHFIFFVSSKISLQKIEYNYGIVPLFVGLHCAIEVYKELCLCIENDLREEFLALSFSRVSPDRLFSCLHDAVALCLERMMQDMLEKSSAESSSEDRITLSNRKKLSIHHSIFRLLVEMIEPCACLLQGYAERLEPFVAASCPYWFRAVTESTKLFWGILGSAALRGCALLQGAATNDALSPPRITKTDYFLLFLYLRQRFSP